VKTAQRFLRWPVLAIIGAGIVLTATMSERWQRRARVLGELVTALSTNVPTMHVWLEEAIVGDPYVNVDRDVFDALNRAASESERCASLLPTGTLGTDAQAVASRVRELGRRARERLDTRTQEGWIGTDADQEFDAVYNDILARTESLRVAWTAAEESQLFWLRVLGGELFVAALLAAYLAVRATRLGHDLSEQNAKLEERTEAARLAMAIAEDASRAKGEFLASMSHEIRTPLNAVIGFCDVLSESKLDLQQNLYVTMMRSSGDLLLDLVNDILDFSKIEARQLELERAPFHLLEAVEDALEVVAANARKKGIDLAVVVDGASLPREVVGDRVRFRQIVLNLVANAVKFTDRGEVVVRLEALGRDPDLETGMRQIRVTVHDTGTGIAPERIERLFSPFQQADASITRERGGTGLGLTISKQLAELMGGTLSVRSRLGVGSDFIFELPVDAQRDSATDGVVIGLQGRRALIVDDHEASRLVVKQHLLDFGMEGVEAADLGVALSVAERGQAFDVIVLDQHLGDSLGTSLARELQAFDATRGCPVVLLTSEAGPARAAHEDGIPIRATLLKPVRRARLREVLSSILRRSTSLVSIAPPASSTPSAPSAPHSSSPSVATRPSARKEKGVPVATGAARVLVVDDNAVNLELARALFATLGVVIATGESAADALAAVERQAFDVILLDLHMPEVDGIRGAHLLREKLGVKTPRLFALTADVTEKARQACLDAGFERVLTKPIRASTLAGIFGASESGRPAAEVEKELDTSNLELLARDPARVRRTCSMFLDNAAKTESILVAACAAGDATVVAEKAHSLRGASASIGTWRLHEALKRLEEAAQRRATVEMRTIFGEVRERLVSAKRALETWLEAHVPPVAAGISGTPSGSPAALPSAPPAPSAKAPSDAAKTSNS
jgi:signal transduction histidine kinase/CheY-like chemotaxis protein